ncbi:hypothetical protein ETH_00028655, partial [Eimeria tenella]
LVFPKAVKSKHLLVLHGVVPVDEMRGDYLASVQLICDSIPYSLIRHYGISPEAYRSALKLNPYSSSSSSSGSSSSSSSSSVGGTSGPLQQGARVEAAALLASVAAQRHFMSGGRGGQLDLHRVAKLLLRDFSAGRLCCCREPSGAVFGAAAEAAGAQQFLAAVCESLEAKIAAPRSSAAAAAAAAAAPAAAAPAAAAAASSSRKGKKTQMNPADVLRELEEDADLMQVIGSAGGGQNNASLVVTKRKARQMQKQLLKGKGSKNLGGFAHRI